MKLSSYFSNLRSAYQAEIDDLTSDSDGQDVLRQRLKEKRQEMDFLVQMMDLSPEMVAVVFHQGFIFSSSKAASTLAGLLASEMDDLPDWGSVSNAVSLQPWAQTLANTVLKEPTGATFLAVAAGLEYLYHHGHAAAGSAAPADEEDNEALEHDDDYNHLDADDARDPQNDRSREEARANWLSDLGFDRKD